MSCPVLHNCGNVRRIFRTNVVVMTLHDVVGTRAPRMTDGALQLLSTAGSRSPLPANAA
jgi:hypothetical protein